MYNYVFNSTIFEHNQAAFIGDGFEEFEIDEVLEDPAYQEQFLQFLNNTHVQ